MAEVIVNPSTTAVEPGERARKAGSLVTVIVSCCGQLEYTRLCVPSLVRCTRQPYELFFLDCDSLDGTAEYLDGFAAAAPVRVEVARVPADPPSGPGRKEDTISIRGDFIAFVNNDTILTEGWLDSLIAAVQGVPEAGMAAPMSNNAAGQFQVDPVPYGIDDWSAGQAEPTFRLGHILIQIDKVNSFAKDWRERNRNQAFETDSVAGGCALIKREVFQKLGLVPTRTALGNFDLDALASRIRQAGYRLAGSREAYVHNFGSRGLAG